MHYLGRQNQSKSSKDFLSFGSGKNLAKVTLTGEYRGYYKDWTTGERGNLINLIKNIEDISFKEAVNKAEILLAAPTDFNLTANDKNTALIDTLPKQLSQLKGYAVNYDKTSQPIQGT